MSCHHALWRAIILLFMVAGGIPADRAAAQDPSPVQGARGDGLDELIRRKEADRPQTPRTEKPDQGLDVPATRDAFRTPAGGLPATDVAASGDPWAGRHPMDLPKPAESKVHDFQKQLAQSLLEGRDEEVAAKAAAVLS